MCVLANERTDISNVVNSYLDITLAVGIASFYLILP